jgi:hypothetical protein
MGLDTPVGEDAITMSGVFRQVAIISSLAQFDDLIPSVYGKYKFGRTPADRTAPTRGATDLTQEVGVALSYAHAEWGRTIKEAALRVQQLSRSATAWNSLQRKRGEGSVRCFRCRKTAANDCR